MGLLFRGLLQKLSATKLSVFNAGFQPLIPRFHNLGMLYIQGKRGQELPRS